jgi:hypothetical protein
MFLSDPDAAYDWRSRHVSWRDIKAAAVLALSLGLAVGLLF